MLTTYEVVLIKEHSKYVSSCSGVFFTKDKIKPWAVWFKTEDAQIPLGHFEHEGEAIKTYTDYHEKYYTEILNQIKLKKEKDESK